MHFVKNEWFSIVYIHFFCERRSEPLVSIVIVKKINKVD